MKIKLLANGVDTATLNLRPQDKIENVRPKISQALGADKYPVERLRLIYAGKQLEDGATIFEYDVKHGCTILVFLKAVLTEGETVVDNIKVNSNQTSNTGEAINSDQGFYIPEEVEKIADQILEEEGEWCKYCKNNRRKRCKVCGCGECGIKTPENDSETVVCEECGVWWHWICLTPPMTVLPEDDWYCQHCRHDNDKVLTAGKKLDISHSKKAKLPSAKQKRQWGGGMACVGRSKECTIVPKNFVGKIPGIPVGSSWKYRMGCSESGVHRPPVSGIAGGTKTGAVSICLSGGYPEDVDDGEEFTYTGAGGRDLSGNKRSNVQSMDQKLTSTNLALAMTCAAPVNDKKGATAVNWKDSRSIRVIRTARLKKHNPKYAPEEGVRYDGLYKVVKYWPDKGQTGFKVWRYFLRRDDDEPVPWSKEGQQRIQKLGLTMYIPEVGEDSAKRKLDESNDFEDLTPSKKRKPGAKYKPSEEMMTLIKQDKVNKRPWKLVLAAQCANEQEFLNTIQKEFVCPVCLDMVQMPVNLPCQHITCQECIIRAMRSDDCKCPNCRADTTLKDKDGTKIKFKPSINLEFIAAMRVLFPGYCSDMIPSTKKGD